MGCFWTLSPPAVKLKCNSHSNGKDYLNLLKIDTETKTIVMRIINHERSTAAAPPRIGASRSTGRRGGARRWWWMAMIDMQHDGAGLVAEIEPGAGGEDSTVRIMWAGVSEAAHCLICGWHLWKRTGDLRLKWWRHVEFSFGVSFAFGGLSLSLAIARELWRPLLIPWFLSDLNHLFSHI